MQGAYVSFRDDNIRVDHKWVNGEPRYSVRSASEIDAQDGTDIVAIGELMSSAKSRGNKRGKQHYYKLSKTSDVVRGILSGEYFTVRSGTILGHAGKDYDHLLTVDDWRNISEALHDPLVIAKYSFKGSDGIVHRPANSYRVWVEAVINGHFAMVGVDVKSPSKDISVNSVSTIYGDEIVSLNEDDVVYSRRNGEGIRTLLGGPNPREYSESPHAPDSIANPGADVNDPDIRLSRPLGGGSLFVAGRARVADDAGVGEWTPGAIAASEELSGQGTNPISAAGSIRHLSLPLSEMEWLRKKLTGNVIPAHVAKRIPGGAASAHNLGGKLVIAADVFGSAP